MGLKAPQGYDNWQGQVTLARGEKKTVEVRLLLLPQAVKTTSLPPGARILIDGQDTGKTTPAELSLPPGDHVLRLELEGYQPEEIDVSLTGGQIGPLEITLTQEVIIVAKTGSISVNASLWAKVFLDGTEFGLTPLTIEGVAAGMHTIRLEYDGQTYEDEVKVNADESATVSHSFY